MNNFIHLVAQGIMSAKNAMCELGRQNDIENEMVDALRSKEIVSLEQYCYGTRLYDVLNTNSKIPQTFEEEMAMSYEEYVVYLLNKYGPAQYNYFYNEMCATKNPKIERFNDGLFCHNIAEECGVLFKPMVETSYAKSKPFSLYEAKNFIYANYFEHLILHIKIAQEDIAIANETPMGVDLAGARLIWRELSRFYETGKVPLAHKKAAEIIEHRYEQYLGILRWMLGDFDLSKYVDVEDFSLDLNGFVLPKILHDLGGSVGDTTQSNYIY